MDRQGGLVVVIIVIIVIIVVALEQTARVPCIKTKRAYYLELTKEQIPTEKNSALPDSAPDKCEKELR